MKKPENDIFLSSPVVSQQPEKQQLELFRVRPALPAALAKTPDWVIGMREERQKFDAVVAELFPEYIGKRSVEIPMNHYSEICREFHRRHPRVKPERRSPKRLPNGEYRIFRVFWTNPYAEPPKGLPRELWGFQSELDFPTGRQQDKIDRILERAPTGYSLGISFRSQAEDSGARKWSWERKVKNRLRLLKARISKQYSIPELYEKALQRAIARKPEYYGVAPLNLPLSLRVPEMEAIEQQSVEAQPLRITLSAGSENH